MDYKRALDGLSNIREMCGCKDSLDLPQLVVVGDQTSGKSSLLDVLTGVSFPVKSGICTRVPIVVHTKHSADTRCEIQTQSKNFETVEPGKLSTAIANAQRKLLSEAGDAKVAKRELVVKVSGPDQQDIIVVDLPGIIHNGEGKDETVALIEDYIRSPQTLILLVSEAKQDRELTSALSLTEKHDPRGERTLRCLSKFDTFDSEESRKSATRLIEDGRGSELGPHAVVCRFAGGKDYSEEEEEEAFEENARVTGTTAADRMGSSSLRSRLPRLFSKLVQTNLPKLEASAAKKQSEAEKELAKMGDRPMSPFAMVRECQRVLALPQSRIDKKLTPFITEFREALHSSGESVTEESVKKVMKENAFVCPFFYGEDAYKICLSNLIAEWKRPAQKLVYDIECEIASSMSPVCDEAIGVSNRLKEQLDVSWSQKKASIVEELRSAVLKSVSGAETFGTANHYLWDNFCEEVLIPDSFIEKLQRRLDAKCPYKFAANEIICVIKDERTEMCADERRKSIYESAARRAYCAVRATWKVEKKSVVDNVLKEVRDLVIKERNEWIETNMLTDEAIVAAAVEDDNVCEMRAALKERIAKMKGVIQEIQEINGSGTRSETQSEAFEEISPSMPASPPR